MTDQTWTDHGAWQNCYDDICEEHTRQIAKWGFQKHPPHIWMSILTEEVGELAKAILEMTHPRSQGARPNACQQIRKEAIHVATTALKIAEMSTYEEGYDASR